MDQSKVETTVKDKKASHITPEILEHLDTKLNYQKFNLNIFSTIKKSWLTEKVYKEINNKNIYVFEVNKHANASEIKHDFQILFNVKVEKVNIVKVKRRKKRLGKHQGWKPERKKAYIKLRKGEKISVFEEDFKEINSSENIKPNLSQVKGTINQENLQPVIDVQAKEEDVSQKVYKKDQDKDQDGNKNK